MRTPERRTLRRAARLRGRALFSGGAASVRLGPAEPGSGWSLCIPRSPGSGARDGALWPLEPAQWEPLPHRGTLRAPDGRVVTLPEHLLAALLLLDVDDCEIRWEALGPDGAGGAETPILDGSAGDFVRAIRAAGVTGAGRRAPAPLAVSISWGGRAISWSASDGPWPCRARTFIGLPQGRAALGAGLFPGARPGCAVVLGENGASARWGGRPRLPDEPLVHKLLDLLGDLGPWRARGRLSGELHVAAPSHHTNGASIAAAIASGRLRWLA